MGMGLVAVGMREMRPLLLKVGVALVLSVAGFLYGHLRPRGDRPRRLRRFRTASGSVIEGETEAGGDFKEELPLGQGEEESSDTGYGIPGIIRETATCNSGMSPGSKNSGDEGYLLSEFNELVLREFESCGLQLGALETGAACKSLQEKEGKTKENEVVALKNLARLLQERVENLEIQLLEYYGLREHESTVRELGNHLKATSMEAKHLSLKVESLEAENQKLATQVSDCSRVKAELELAWTNIKNMEMKLRSDSVQANEKVSELHHRIAALKEREWSRVEESNEVLQEKLKCLNDEAAELKSVNSKLSMETSDLAKKLSLQLAAASVTDSKEVVEALEEANRLRQANDSLSSEIAQLQIDRCADVEELVYLRWINACLRYELRNYHPSSGQNVASDLSKTLSPRSEQKAKQLILEYANSGSNEKSANLVDFDVECCSSSQSSSLTECGEVDDSLTETTSTTTKHGGSNKTSILRKLKRLVRGKDRHYRKSSWDRSPTSCDTLERRASVSGCSFDDILERSSYDSAASFVCLDNIPGNQLMAVNAPWTKNLSRVSLDFRRLKSSEEFGEVKRERRRSDVGHSYRHVLRVGDESFLQSPPTLGEDQETFDLAETLEKKSGRALHGRRGKPKVRSR